MAEWNIRETPLHELERDAAIRFAAIHGNTIALMDMGRNPKIYLIDLGWFSKLFVRQNYSVNRLHNIFVNYLRWTYSSRYRREKIQYETACWRLL